MLNAFIPGTVVAFAGQVEPVSGDANNKWSGSGCPSANAQSVKADDQVPLNIIESYGWMLCDGRTLNKLNYPELFSVLGYLYGGSGDNFVLPDYRGLFLRGTDAGSGMDPDAAKRMKANGDGKSAAIGSYQCDALQTHTHTYQAVSLAAVSQSGSAAAQTTTDKATSAPDSPAKTSSETRPKNISVNYIIKYR